MESFSRDTEGSTEDIPGRKKSKLKALKTRLFGRSKRGGGEVDAKLSQSASDITAGKGLGSNEDLACSQGMMGSRALSHDSIFLADLVLTDTEPARVLSQENVHSKIKALQIKLQQQKMHLGPPPLVPPIRRPEDLGSRSEDDSLAHSPPEISGALSKTPSQPSSRPLSPIPKPAPTKSVPLTPSLPLPLSVSSHSSSSAVEPPIDFSSPAQFTPCLDTSAARHRMSVKPRNQRASTKKTLAANHSKSHLHTLNNTNNPESVREEERRRRLSTQEEVTLETEQEGAVTPVMSQRLPSKSPEVAPIISEAASKSSGLIFSQQDQALLGTLPSIPSQLLRVKPHRPADVMPRERPHSSFIQSELKDNREYFEIQLMSHDKRNTLNKAEVSSDQHPTPFSSVHQQVQGETESTRGIKRPTPGSGSFHFALTTAKNQDGERPRSCSFVGVLGHTEGRQKTVGGTKDKRFSSMREKEELRGGPFAVGRLRQEEAPHKSLVPPWDRRDSLKKMESVTTPSKNVSADTGAAEVEESSQEVEEAAEAQEVEEKEGKKAFGVKLRSTSLSMRFRSDTSSNRNSKPPLYEEQCDKQKRLEIRDLRLTDPTPSGFSLPVKHNPPSTSNPHIMATEVQTTSSNLKEVETAITAPQEPQAAPQTSSSEVSWMSLAMEKTRSLQHLFTSRLPRDFTGVQTAARPQVQMETLTGAQVQTQTVKIQQSTTSPEAASQQSTDALKAETVQSRSQAQTVKPSLIALQQKTPPVQSNTSREPQTLKQMSEPQSASHSASHPAVQTNPWTTQSPLHSSTQSETSSPFAQGSVTQSLAQSYLSSGQQQLAWNNRGLHPSNQLKSTTSVSTTSSATAPPPVSAFGRGEREATVQEKEGASQSGRQAGWAGSVSEKAAFLKKRAEWTTPSGTKGVELRKAQTEVQTSGESPASVKTMPLNKDIKPEGRQGVKPAESSPTKVPDRPREDKWLRKNVGSSPSSSPTMPSALQSMSDSSQPSWMELAKRKSMAWSDKSMD
ncbi:platelet binding protein GspB [Sander lucioperca]|uniref:platelet binding protein GspB n=1 Tax=Sander lucioperca TaxID=283035 RepID=UPI00125E95F6|nr:platelet binding protein GspB [Sander lucioperca]